MGVSVTRITAGAELYHLDPHALQLLEHLIQRQRRQQRRENTYFHMAIPWLSSYPISDHSATRCNRGTGLCFRHYQWPSASGQGPHPPSCRLLRRELEQRLLLGEHIDRAVRPHSHVADAGLEFSQQRLLGHHLVVLELQAIDADAAQAAREQAAAPLREKPAVIISQARRGDHRVPVIDRLLHALLGGLAIEHRAAGIIDAVGNDGPALIPALPAAAALLAAAPAGTLGVTEHGPRGGDELN